MQVDVQSKVFTVDSQGRQKFAGQSLLGLSFPTTPDIGLNNSPVMYGLSGKDGDHRVIASGELVAVGGGRAMVKGTAQHALLASGAHLGRGGLALLTPPDDNGVIDWRHDSTQPAVIKETKDDEDAGGESGGDTRKSADETRLPTDDLGAATAVEGDRTNPNRTEAPSSEGSSQPGGEHLTPLSVDTVGAASDPGAPEKEPEPEEVGSPSEKNWIEGVMDVLGLLRPFFFGGQLNCLF